MYVRNLVIGRVTTSKTVETTIGSGDADVDCGTDAGVFGTSRRRMMTIFRFGIDLGAAVVGWVVDGGDVNDDVVLWDAANG